MAIGLLLFDFVHSSPHLLKFPRSWKKRPPPVPGQCSACDRGGGMPAAGSRWSVNGQPATAFCLLSGPVYPAWVKVRLLLR